MNEYKYSVYVAKNEYESDYNICINCDDIREFFGVIDFNGPNMEIKYYDRCLIDKNEYEFVGYVMCESAFAKHMITSVDNVFLKLFNKVQCLLLENTPEVLL